MNKIVLCPERLRQIPRQFSWIDQDLARRRFFQQAPPEAWALYCFSVTVADAQGLSYYSERTLCQRLNLNSAGLTRAREALLTLKLIAYRAPLTQVLALPAGETQPAAPTSKSQALVHIACLHHALGKGKVARHD